MAVFIARSVPHSVRSSQPLSVRSDSYPTSVKFSDPKTFLWGNICRLAGIGESPSLDDVQARVGVGRGTVQRIKEGESATRLSSLTAIAEKLDVPTWRLLQDEAVSVPDAAKSVPSTGQSLDEMLSMLSAVLNQADDQTRARVAERLQAFAAAPDSRIARDALRAELLRLDPIGVPSETPYRRERRHDNRPVKIERRHMGGMSYFGGLDDVPAVPAKKAKR